jgi:hypothetical protein
MTIRERLAVLYLRAQIKWLEHASRRAARAARQRRESSR